MNSLNSPSTKYSRRIKVAALIVGEPRGEQLWTLRNIYSGPCELHVIQGLRYSDTVKLKRAHRQIKAQGLLYCISRWMGSMLIRRSEREHHQRILDQLFDADWLREWWKQSRLKPIKVPHLNHADCEAALKKIRPDILVRVSGGILKTNIFRQARLAALNIHHGQAHLVRGLWNIVWSIIENKREWVGATIHEIDKGIDTGAILWRGTPQLAPGDTAVTLYFRAHLEAVAALVYLLKTYATGETPARWVVPSAETSTYRSSPGLCAWLKFLLLGRGLRARFLLERAVEC